MRDRLAFFVRCLPLLLGSQLCVAQNYLLPEGTGKSEIIGSCETCHGVMAVISHKRSPSQWDEMVKRMMTLGAPLTDSRKKIIIGYLNAHYGQARNYVPTPPPLRGRGPGLALALEAAQTAQHACEAKGSQVSTLVVDSGGTTLVLLTGDGVPSFMSAIAATKTAAVLKFKEPTGVTMQRLERDPVLVAQVKEDPEIGEIRQGGLPIVVGNEIVGAIAVAGAFGPANSDELCAQAGLETIASRLH